MAKKTNKEAAEKSAGYPKLIDRRLEQIRFTIEDNKVDAVAITHLPNIRYLTNFSGTAGTLFVTPDAMHFFTDDRYEEQIKDELYELENLKTYVTRDVWGAALEENVFEGISIMGFEADKMAYSEAIDIRNKIRPVKFKPTPEVAEPFTMPKAEEELENIKAACEIAEKVYEKILKFVKPDKTEKDIAIEIAHQTRLLGSEADPFPIIVVSGKRGSLIHGKPSDKEIKKGDIVIIDFGATVNGFVCDITRTFAVDKATKEQKDIYSLLRKAENEAIKEVRPGMNGQTVDAAARDIIKKAGFGEYFQHSLGHGIGLVAHEKPTLTFRMEDQIVPEDAVLAIEPGIYLPDKFGMRVEDNILVTRNGGEKLTDAPDELVVI